MSIASKVGQVTFSQKSGVYMAAILCDKGDLYQEYDGDSSAPTNIAPDFTTLKPTLSFLLTSSRVAEGIVVPSSIKWYFNDVLINFTSNVSTNTFGGETGHFKFVPYAAGTTNYYGLQVVKNLVKASAGASCTIKGVATVTVGNVSDEIQWVYPIPITKGVGNQKVVTIMAGDDKYFAIREKGTDSRFIIQMVQDDQQCMEPDQRTNRKEPDGNGQHGGYYRHIQGRGISGFYSYWFGYSDGNRFV